VYAIQIQDFVLTFTSILWEALPFIVLGAVIAGVLEELLPQQLINRFMPKYAIPAVLIGGLLGLAFPMCECGIVVVMRRLLRKGLPLACCLTYMLAGPIVNVVVLFSTYVAFGGLKPDGGSGWQMVLMRAGLGFGVACVTGLVVFLLEKRVARYKLLTPLAAPEPVKKGISLGMVEAVPEPEPAKPVWQRLSNISATALHDFVDITVFLILGAAAAATAKMLVTQQDINAFSTDHPSLIIPAMMLMAVLMCLCSEADAFVAASFTEMAVAPKLAFLVLGPMLDLKLLLMYTRVFRWRLIAVLVMCTTVQVFAYTTLVHSVPALTDFATGKKVPAAAAGGGGSNLPAGEKPKG
jgi:uncharacterized protein